MFLRVVISILLFSAIAHARLRSVQRRGRDDYGVLRSDYTKGGKIGLAIDEAKSMLKGIAIDVRSSNHRKYKRSLLENKNGSCQVRCQEVRSPFQNILLVRVASKEAPTHRLEKLRFRNDLVERIINSDGFELNEQVEAYAHSPIANEWKRQLQGVLEARDYDFNSTQIFARFLEKYVTSLAAFGNNGSPSQQSFAEQLAKYFRISNQDRVRALPMLLVLPVLDRIFTLARSEKETFTHERGWSKFHDKSESLLLNRGSLGITIRHKRAGNETTLFAGPDGNLLLFYPPTASILGVGATDSDGLAKISFRQKLSLPFVLGSVLRQEAYFLRLFPQLIEERSPEFLFSWSGGDERPETGRK